MSKYGGLTTMLIYFKIFMMLLIFQNASALAKCMSPSVSNFRAAPIVFHSVVEKNTKINLKDVPKKLLNQYAGESNEVFLAKMRIETMIKGNKITFAEIIYAYTGSMMCPQPALFEEGSEWIMAIKEADADGRFYIGMEMCNSQAVSVDSSFAEQVMSSWNYKFLNKKKAISYGEEKLVKTYGKQVLSQRPFIVTSTNDNWIMDGTFHCPSGQICLGGVAHIEFRKRDGTVLSIIHGK